MAVQAALVAWETWWIARLGPESLDVVLSWIPLVFFIRAGAAAGLGNAAASWLARTDHGTGLPGGWFASVRAARSLALAFGLLGAGGAWIFTHVSGPGSEIYAVGVIVWTGLAPLHLVAASLLRTAGKAAWVARTQTSFLVAGAAVFPCAVHGTGAFPSWGLAGAALLLAGTEAVLLAMMWTKLAQESKRLKRTEESGPGHPVGPILYLALPTLFNIGLASAATACWLTMMDGAGPLSTAMALVLRFETVLISVLFGFGTALVTLGGRAWGRGDRTGCGRVASTGAVWMTVLSVPWFVALFFFPETMLAGFGIAGHRDHLALLQSVAWAGPAWAVALAFSFTSQGCGYPLPATAAAVGRTATALIALGTAPAHHIGLWYVASAGIYAGILVLLSLPRWRNPELPERPRRLQLWFAKE
jgi:Na+-driven multidrug efflux pump